MKLSGPVSLVLLLVLTGVCAAYLTVGVLDLDPRRTTNTVTVLMDSSGGLMQTSQVDLRGMRIGRVRAITATGTGLAVRLELDAKYRVPIGSEVRVSNLSAAGEQFMDFRPTGMAGPYLTDGSVVPARQVRVATTVSEALAKLDVLNAQIDPAKIERLAAILSQGYAGREREIATLTKALTMTAQLLHDKRDAITRLYLNGQALAENFDGYGPVIGGWAADFTEVLPEAVHLIKSFQGYSYAGEQVWDEPLGPLVQKIDQYLAVLGPDLAHIATALRPSTSVLKPVRVDAGSIIDLLSAVFPGNGTARVTLDVPK
ncbi:phospholipid/cholesterol/gamma-HCH transport system substrate-binding protein [Nocardia tenerifensis]|uniref:Phospholipid/cholesterol/gamma-HCH transport system substrate-binding protein n=1 Tax=Nocardia tenerifensis TaxID=228006 RepID=A0A318JRY6_9NOCA|nr:MlaD family protein [Nocardia tenerifensis]PXX53306.1 phospholipid/cholesterol/gamma-HCH transport system substrate-binding protein [Nocardia tenerifensis]